jgi:hypothetical protein
MLIGPGEWESATARTYAAPKEMVFSAALLYFQSAGSVTLAEREAGLINAKFGNSNYDLSMAFAGMSVIPEYSCVVSALGDSAKVTLKVTDTYVGKNGQPAAGSKVDNVRPRYTAAFDSIGAYVRRLSAGGARP